MSEVKIISTNCQGLHDSRKRKDVLQYYRQLQCNVLCLQDTHFTKDMENNIQSEWGYEVYFNSFTSQSRGIAIFLNNNFDYKVHNKLDDTSGNFLALDITFSNTRVSLVVIYGPNEDDPQFYKMVSEAISNLENDNVIMVGDFNLVINPEKDYHNYLHINNSKARETVLEIISAHNLSDVYREIYPEKIRYTWRKPNPLKQARLDFFLISNSLLNMVQANDILASYKSDHSPVVLSLKLDNFTHGKGLWKFNNSLLHDYEYIKIINRTILQVKENYALPIYSKDYVTTISDHEIQFTINDQLFLETLLMEIRGKTISFSSFTKKRNNEKEKNLISEINTLEENYEHNALLVNEKKKELENIRNHRLIGSIVRSRAKWTEEGEKPTNYFLNLENRHYTNKIIPKLIKEENQEEIVNQIAILNEIEQFYRKLYDANDKHNDYNLNEILIDPMIKKTR